MGIRQRRALAAFAARQKPKPWIVETIGPSEGSKADVQQIKADILATEAEDTAVERGFVRPPRWDEK